MVVWLCCLLRVDILFLIVPLTRFCGYMFFIKVCLIREILFFRYSEPESEKALSVKLFITAILYCRGWKESKCRYGFPVPVFFYVLELHLWILVFQKRCWIYLNHYWFDLYGQVIICHLNTWCTVLSQYLGNLEKRLK